MQISQGIWQNGNITVMLKQAARVQVSQTDRPEKGPRAAAAASEAQLKHQPFQLLRQDNVVCCLVVAHSKDQSTQGGRQVYADQRVIEEVAEIKFVQRRSLARSTQVTVHCSTCSTAALADLRES
jgi:hypothetical protein